MRKNKVLFTVIAILLCTNIHAQTRTVTLNEDDALCDGGKIEIINYDDDKVTISADTLIHDVTVVIKDKCGNTIYANKTTLEPIEKTIAIPKDYKNDKYVIEIYYDDKILYGFFKQ